MAGSVLDENPGSVLSENQHAIAKDSWRERDGKLQKGPFELDKTRVSVSTESHDPLTGEATISVQAIDAGSSPCIHWAVGTAVSEASDELKELRFKTKELRLSFLAVDPTKAAPTGDRTVWKNRISILFDDMPSVDGREISIVVTPGASSVRYTTDASSPRASGQEYGGPFVVPADHDVMVRVLAVDGDIEAEEQKRFDRKVKKFYRLDDDPDPQPRNRVPTVREHVDERKPAVLASSALAWTATKLTYDALDVLEAASASAVGKRLSVGEGDRAITMGLGSDAPLCGKTLKTLISAARDALVVEEATTTMTLKSIRFPTGADLIAFLETTKIEVGDPRTSISQDEAA